MKTPMLRRNTLPPGPTPLHLRLQQVFLRQMEDGGELRPGGRMPSERELCALYGVSTITVRRALSELVAAGRVIRQAGVGTFVTSVRGRAQLGLVVFGFDEEDWHRNSDIHGDLIGGIASACWEHEAVFSLIRAPLNTPIAPLLESLVSERLFDGLILRTAGDFLGQDVVPLVQSKVPFVLVKRTIEQMSVNCVVVDEFQGGYLATKHLVDLGHRNIAFIGPTGLSIFLQGYQGYVYAMQEAGLVVDPSLVRVIPASRQSDAYEASRELLNCELPTAIFAAGDVLAEGVYQACSEAGLAIPKDVSVVGHDDCAAAIRLRPLLTTMHFSYHDLGFASTELLLEALVSSDHNPAPRREVIVPRLVIRESTCPPRSGLSSLQCLDTQSVKLGD